MNSFSFTYATAILALGISQYVLVSLLQNNKDVGGRRYSLHINKLGKKS